MAAHRFADRDWVGRAALGGGDDGADFDEAGGAEDPGRRDREDRGVGAAAVLEARWEQEIGATRFARLRQLLITLNATAIVREGHGPG